VRSGGEMTQRPFVFLSSGATRQYRDDIIRALALPEGAALQFRYRLDGNVCPFVQSHISDGATFDGATALLCYFDRVLEEAVPCRFATIVSVRRHGSTVSIKFRIAQYAKAIASQASFTSMLRAVCTSDCGSVPSSANPAEPLGTKRLLGHFWLAPTIIPASVVPAGPPEAEASWETAVNELVKRTEFPREVPFLRIQGIYLSGTKPVAIENYQYRIGANTSAELLIYHYIPEELLPDSTISVSTNSSAIAFTGRSIFVLESPYDLKTVRFVSSNTRERQHGVIAITYSSPKLGGDLVLDLPVAVGAGWRRTLLVAATIGVFLWVNATLPSLRDLLTSNSAISDSGKVKLLGFQLAAAFAAAAMAAFGIRKPS
jgi:hypothetical protein